MRLRSVGSKLLPAVNVKVRHGLESITAEEWDDLRSDTEALPAADGTVFDRNFVEAYDDKEGLAWDHACSDSFGYAEADAKALFGEHIKCWQDGRSGGWLVVEGLPERDDWNEPIELPNLKGSRVGGARRKDGTILPDNAGLLERWEFFEKACAAYVRDVPYLYAWDIANHVWNRKVESTKAEAKEKAERQARITTIRRGLGKGTAKSQRIAALRALTEIEKDYV